jgi:cobalt/nickel transport system permease protein
MHIAEGLLPPAHALAWTAAAVPFVAAGARHVSRVVRTTPGAVTGLGAAAGFVLVLSSLKLPSVAGSSSHPTGVGLGVVLCGPGMLAPLTAIVLVFQALLLGHGGLTTLGANVWAMGVAGPWAMWAVRATADRLGRRPLIGLWLGTFAGVLATYLTTAGQLALADAPVAGGAWPAFIGFAAVFGITQLPLALGEATLTMWAVRTLGVAPVDTLTPRDVRA